MKFLFFIFFLFFTSSTFAVELYEVNTNVRALGMGNAYSAIVRDSDSFFYNPAGLSASAGYHWTIMDPVIGAGGVDSLTELQSLSDASDFAAALAELYGKHIWLGGGAKTAVITPYFSFAYYDNFDLSMDINNPAIPEIEANVINDLGYMLGFSFPILPNFHMGMVIKRIARTGSRGVIGTADLGTLDSANIQTSILNEGVGFAADLGVNFYGLTSGPVQPSFSFVWKNMGTTTYRATGSSPAPPSDKDEMVLGAAINIDVGLISVTPTFDYKYMNNNDAQLTKKIHMGLEIGLPLVALRAGLHQGYYTLGAGMDMGFLQVDLATWGVEMGDYPGQQEDRRYAIQLKFELGFDGDLNLLSGGPGANAKGRKRLKQRR